MAIQWRMRLIIATRPRRCNRAVAGRQPGAQKLPDCSSLLVLKFCVPRLVLLVQAVQDICEVRLDAEDKVWWYK